MKSRKRTLLTIGCIALLVISWIGVLGADSKNRKQEKLLEQGMAYFGDEIYILATPVLEEAVALGGKYTLLAETELKKCYLHLIGQSGYEQKYINVLEGQMGRNDAAADVFMEAAKYYLETGKEQEAFAVLRHGIGKTEDEKLTKLYEDKRYIYGMDSNVYENVTAIHNKTIGVELLGLWGLAAADGTLLVPCAYEKISTFSEDRAIAKKNGDIFAVDSKGNRLALCKEAVKDFGNYVDGRVPVLTKDGWVFSTGEFELRQSIFQEVGTFCGGYVAASENGAWGVMNEKAKWVIPPEYDEIMMNELGCSYAQECVFAKKNGVITLFVDGKEVATGFEDAKPFEQEGYAAVMKNGLWGFIDITGEVKINYQFKDALSFGGHLAAVQVGQLWGYVSLSGDVVIKPTFLQAKSFSQGNAPVLTERGWQIITLFEYEKGASL